jgi:hypothetical protein
MTIRLNGQTSGYVELEAPATAGSNTLVLPTNNGTSGQYLQTNGSGALSWQTVTPAAFESYAVICDQKPNDNRSGTFNSGAWRTRDLNTEITDVDGIVSISSNQFTLGAGTYLICWSAPGYAVNRHLTRLYDVTNTSGLRAGTPEYANQGNSAHTRSEGWHRLTISGNTTYEIQHQCQTTSLSDTGFGLDANFGEVETYTVVQIYKEA